MGKEELDDTISSMLKYTSILTQEIIDEALKYNPNDERIFIKGAEGMVDRIKTIKGRKKMETKLKSENPNKEKGIANTDITPELEKIGIRTNEGGK